MDILIDSNLLVRLANKADAQRPIAIEALRMLHANGHTPVVVPQVYYEYWVVATRPTGQNGLGMSPEEVVADFIEIHRDYKFLDDEPGILALWRGLTAKYAILGKPAHDARLVATMIRHGVTHLLTFNAADFARFAEITAVAPAAAAAAPPASE